MMPSEPVHVVEGVTDRRVVEVVVVDVLVVLVEVGAVPFGVPGGLTDAEPLGSVVDDVDPAVVEVVCVPPGTVLDGGGKTVVVVVPGRVVTVLPKTVEGTPAMVVVVSQVPGTLDPDTGARLPEGTIRSEPADVAVVDDICDPTDVVVVSDAAAWYDATVFWRLAIVFCAATKAAAREPGWLPAMDGCGAGLGSWAAASAVLTWAWASNSLAFTGFPSASAWLAWLSWMPAWWSWLTAETRFASRKPPALELVTPDQATAPITAAATAPTPDTAKRPAGGMARQGPRL